MNSAYSLTVNVFKLSPETIGPQHSPELLGFNVNSISRQSARLRNYHYDTWTFLPDSRNGDSRKVMKAFLSLPLLLSCIRDEAGAICDSDWDLQAGVCEGPARGISRTMAPIRFHRDIEAVKKGLVGIVMV